MSEQANGEPCSQREVVDFLKSGAPFAGEKPQKFRTHAGMVFVAGGMALKIKRAVRYAYLDFSTRAKRKAALDREIELNRPHAIDLYHGVVPIVRQASGELSLGGDGEPVEWALQMRAFAQEDVLAHRIEAGPLAAELLADLADMVAIYHADTPAVPGVDTPAALEAIIAELDHAFSEHPAVFPDEQRASWRDAARQGLADASNVLRMRSERGFVRRCHGDLHLGNIVLWRGQPAAFDALEFDEALATIDTLYDLAFLLMDLDERHHRPEASYVMSRYLWRTGAIEDVMGLAALPLFLSLRAGIRAMVTAQKIQPDDTSDESDGPADPAIAEARAYFAAACEYLVAVPPRLVAVGGFSGTGKTTLATDIAPGLGRPPGAMLLRSDLERKTLYGADEFEQLPPSHYTHASAAAVYARLEARATAALEAGHSVVVDAVFASPGEREAIARFAEANGVPFTGLWLTAPPDVLKARVASRLNDASDATVRVVDTQVERGAGELDWEIVDASGSPAQSLEGARRILDHRSR